MIYPLPSLTLYLDERTNPTLPITGTEPDTDGDGLADSRDQDDDGDGHNDTKDAYPLDPTRWEKPKTGPNPIPGFDTLAFVIVTGILAIAFPRRTLSRGLPRRRKSNPPISQCVNGQRASWLFSRCPQ